MAWIFARRRASRGSQTHLARERYIYLGTGGIVVRHRDEVAVATGVPLATCLRNRPKQSWVYCWWVGSTARKILRLYDHRIPSGRSPSLGFQ
jgi:hypothetical protein